MKARAHKSDNTLFFSSSFFFFFPSRPAFVLLIFHPSICLLLLLFFVVVVVMPSVFSLAAASSCPLRVCGTAWYTEEQRQRQIWTACAGPIYIGAMVMSRHVRRLRESTNSGARQLRPVSHAQEFSYEYQSDFGQQFFVPAIRPSRFWQWPKNIKNTFIK